METDARTGGLGRFLAVNRALCASGDYAREDLLAVGPLSLIHPDDREEAARLPERLRGGEAFSFEAEQRLVRADGGIIRVAITTSLMRDWSGRTCILAHLQDITERATVEAALRASPRDRCLARHRTLSQATPADLARGALAHPSVRSDRG